MKETFNYRQFVENSLYTPEPHGAVLTSQEFLQDFSHEARNADVVFTAVMQFEAGSMGDQVIDVLKNAPKEAKKTVVFDAISSLTSEGVVLAAYEHIPWKKEDVKRRRANYDVLVSRLKETGTEIRILNQPKGARERLFPFTGRSHLKVSFIEKKNCMSTIYIHSGNFDSVRASDIAVKFSGLHARKVIDEYDEVINGQINQDYGKQLMDDLWIFVDSGEPGKSIIFEKGVDLIQQAKESVYFTSQLPPSGEIAEALSKAQKGGKRVEILSTDWSVKTPLYSGNNLMYLISAGSDISSKLNRRSLPVKRDPFGNMHAKMIIIDPFTDSPVADFGSHNYAVSGVKAGTKEVQFRTTDRKIVQTLYRRFEDFKLMITQNKY